MDPTRTVSIVVTVPYRTVPYIFVVVVVVVPYGSVQGASNAPGAGTVTTWFGAPALILEPSTD